MYCPDLPEVILRAAPMSAAERKRWQIAIQVLAGGVPLFMYWGSASLYWGVPLYVLGERFFIFLFYPSCFFRSLNFFYYALGKIWPHHLKPCLTQKLKAQTATERRGDLHEASCEEGKQMPEETSLKLWCLVVASIMMIINMIRILMMISRITMTNWRSWSWL